MGQISERNNATRLGRSICGAALTCAHIASLIVPPPSFAESDGLARRYSLSGSLEVSYDRQWKQGGAAGLTDDFRQSLLLEHRGFISDPNLVSYDLSATFSHDAGQGTLDSSVLGESADVTLLHSLPERWIRYQDYIPHPFYLRFSHDAGSYYQTTNYGLSFMHYAEPKQHVLVMENTSQEAADDNKDAAKTGAAGDKGEDSELYEDAPTKTAKIVEKERTIPIPRTFFDYDHTEVKNEGSPASKNDVVSLRSTLSGEHYDYRFLFENHQETGAVDLSKNVLQLEPIYRFYDKETRRRIDIRNLLRYEDRNGAQSMEAQSSTSYTRPLGKDTLGLTTSLQYAGLSAAGGGSSSNYSGSAGAGYTHEFSPRLTNTSDVSASFTRNLNTENHSERVGDTVSADLSRFFRGTASALVGNDKAGTSYGVNLLLSTKTRIVTSLGYSYNVGTVQVPITTGLPQQDTASNPLQQQNPLLQQLANEKVSVQSVTASATGPLLYNLSFQASAEFKLADVPNAGVIATEQSEALAGNLSWRLGRSSIAMGGNYTQMKVETPSMTDASATTLYGTLTRRLPYNMLFNLYNTWTRVSTSGTKNGDTTTVEIKPSLRWMRGLTTVDAEYSYHQVMGTGSATDNRFFIRLVRKFAAIF